LLKEVMSKQVSRSIRSIRQPIRPPGTAKGDEAKAEAAAAIAHLTVKRYVPLLGTKYISQQEYDQAVATARQADADVIATKAAVDTARINLAYTKVTSP
jgi:multidrug efflux system membrane fusion protein